MEKLWSCSLQLVLFIHLTCSMDTEQSEQTDPSPASLEIESLSREGFQNLVLLTRLSHHLPHETTDYDYYSSFQGFQFFTDKMRERTFSLIQKLSAGISPLLPRLAHNNNNSNKSITLPDIEELFDKIVETNDSGLEQVGHLIDILNGVVPPPPSITPSPATSGPIVIQEDPTPPAPTPASSTPYSSNPQLPTWNRLQKGFGPTNHWARGQMLRSNQISKPQITRHGLDNSDIPFIPSLRGGIKPNAIGSVTGINDHTSLDDLLNKMREQGSARLHPYYDELQEVTYSQSVFQSTEPIHPGPLDSHAYEFITTEDRIDVLVQTLNEATEIAIDLEHHDYRSYLGFTCLIQISITGHDYVIDPLCVGHCLYKLLDPFTNPQIIKVLHGADHDVLWLQRDFGLYLVGMFDTHQSSIVLELPKKSLAFLLSYCCNITASKKFQTADWRVRPLLPQMERYAREDTHYLLYIYHRMRNELIRRSTKDVNLTVEVLNLSRVVCLRIYVKPTFDPQGYLKGLKNPTSRSPLSREITKRLYAWRDRIARQVDESCEYVLPGTMLFQISNRVPTNKHAILGCCNPIPPLVTSSIDELALILKEAEIHCKSNPNYDKLERKIRKSERLNTSVSNSQTSATCPDVLEVSVDRNNDSNHFTPSEGNLTIPEGTASLPILPTYSCHEDKDRKALVDKVLASFIDPFTQFLMRPESSEAVTKQEIHGATSPPVEDGILEQDVIYLAPDSHKPKVIQPLQFTTVKPHKSDSIGSIELVEMEDGDDLVTETNNTPKDFVILGDMKREEMKTHPTQNGENNRGRRERKKKSFRNTIPSTNMHNKPFIPFDYSGMPPHPHPPPHPPYYVPPKRMRFSAPFPRHHRPPMPPPFVHPSFMPTDPRQMLPPMRHTRPFDGGFGVFNRYPPPQHFIRHQGGPWPS